MCGIFGTKNKKKYIKLYLKNKERGEFSYGSVYISKEGNILTRTKTGPLSEEELPDAEYYIGHTRAPTGQLRVFNPYTCHPFIHQKFIYAHNGVLNTSKIEQKYNMKHPVDSMWFSTVLEDTIISRKIQDNITGTYAVWALDQTNNNIFLFRGANPIFWSDDDMSFSSVQLDNSFHSIDEGVVYRFIPSARENLLSVVDTFEYKSPYFIPGS